MEWFVCFVGVVYNKFLFCEELSNSLFLYYRLQQKAHEFVFLKINKILLCLEKEKQSLCSIFCLAVMDLTLKYVKLKSIVLNKIKMGMFHVLWWRKAGLVMEHSQVAHPLTGESTHWSWHANEPFTAFCSNVNIQFRKIWWW